MMEKSANETLLSISLSPSETLPWINVHHHLQNLPLPAGAPRSTCSARAAWRTGTEAPREAERLPSMIRASWCFTGCKRRWDPSSRITTKSTRRPPLNRIRLRASPPAVALLSGCRTLLTWAGGASQPAIALVISCGGVGLIGS